MPTSRTSTRWARQARRLGLLLGACALAACAELVPGAFEPLDARAAPDYAALAADGRVTVAVVFGQMDDDRSPRDDVGQTARARFVASLRALGFEGDEGRLTGRHGGLQIEVRTVGPDRFPLGLTRPELRGLFTEVFKGTEVVYLNGHANQEGLDVLGELKIEPSSEYRVVQLDLCWSYKLYSSLLVDPIEASGGRVHLVSVMDRVVTGSEESFYALLVHLVDGAAFPEARPPWIELLAEMNALADGRADVRHDEVEAKLRPPERYGVSIR